MTTETVKLPEVLEKIRIKAQALHLGRGKNADWDGQFVDRWKVCLSFQRRRFTVDFHMGLGHNGKAPDAASVIHSLVSDADAVDDQGDFVSFDDFCGNIGMSTDSRAALKMYTACKKTLPRLQRFLGDAWEEVVTAARDF